MKRTLITGANRGIGLELCRQLVQRGDEVIAVARRSSPALESLGCKVVADVDVAKPEDIAGLGRRLAGTSLDLVISNAGILQSQSLGAIGQAEIESMLEQFRVNALAPVLLAQALIPCMAPGSRFAIVSSRMGSITDNSSGGSYGYRMSKAAANAAGVSLARDLASRSVSVFLLHPGYVRTEMTGNSGLVDATDSAADLIALLDRLGPGDSGSFYHANGELLPW
jgi:NAD(P)-dependent dehydrogenase (short-subunit alcohol dehydrogenase family)